MEEILIETDDLGRQPEVKEPGLRKTKSNAFDAALEIAEAFGNVPWKPKEMSPSLPANKKDQQESSTSAPREVSQPSCSINESSYKNTAENSEEIHSGFDSSRVFTVFGTGNPRPKRNTQRATAFLNQHNNNNSYQNMSHGFFSDFPVQPAFLKSSDIVFGASHKPEMVNGFGCSNETIARLPGRSRGRGRRGNSGRSRRSRGRTDLTSLQNETRMSAGDKSGTVNLNQAPPASGGQLGGNASKGFSASCFSSQQPNDNTGLYSHPQNEALTVGTRRPSSFGQERKEEVPSKKPCRLTCSYCGKTGHSSDDCFRNPKNQNTKEGLRCYNCNERGHMAVRCTKPMMKTSRNGRISSNKQVKKERKNSITENARKEVGASQNKLPSQTSDLKGLEVICKLMKDKHLREEAAKKTPHLFDEMLSYMIEHISLNVTSK